MERIELPVTTACQLHALLTVISQAIQPILEAWPETEVTDIDAGVVGRPVSDSENNIRYHTPVAWYSVRHTRPTQPNRAIVLTYDHGKTQTTPDRQEIFALIGQNPTTLERLMGLGAMWRYADAER